MIYTTLKYLSIFSTLAPIFLSFYKIRALSKPLRVLLLLFILGFSTDILCLFLSGHKINTTPIFYFYTIIEGILLLNIYRLLLQSQPFNFMISCVMLLFASIAIVSFTFNWTHEILNGIEGTIILFMCSYFFYRLLNQQTVYESILLNPLFWVNSGIFLYFGINLSILIFENTIRASETHIFQFSWSIHLITNTAFNILAAVGLWQIKTK